MQRISHTVFGEAVDTLSLETYSDVPPLAHGTALVRVTATPIHPGDLLGVAASPAFGTPPAIPKRGRVPGFEGVGIVEALAADVDPAGVLQVGARVAFFPVSGTWNAKVVIPVQSLIAVPDEISDEVAAQMLINTLTARLALRAGQVSMPWGKQTEVTVIQTSANSAVGKLLTHMLLEVGIKPILLVRTESSAHAIMAVRPGVPVIVTEHAGWQPDLRRAIGSSPVYVAFDGVGGALLSEVTNFLAFGGTVISYGSLSGGPTDIRTVAPRALSIKGVSLFSWLSEPIALRNADVDTALRLAREFPGLFPVAASYKAADFRRAIEHTVRRGKLGTVLLRF